jgi:DNA polymerase V
LQNIDVGDVWGIGSASSKKLHAANIRTVAALRDADDSWVLKTLSIVGLKLVHELRGIACLPLEMVREPKKGMCVSRSFGHPVTTLEEMHQAIATFAVRIGEKLRSQKSLASVMSVFIDTNYFANEPQCHRHATFRLLVPSAAGNELIRWTAAATERLFCEGFKYKKAGVLVTEIVSDSARQQNLFYQPAFGSVDRCSDL